MLDVLAKAKRFTTRAINRGSGYLNARGTRHWAQGSVILYFDPSPQIIYWELQSVLEAMEYLVQTRPWNYPSYYDVYSVLTGEKKAFLCFLTPEAQVER